MTTNNNSRLRSPPAIAGGPTDQQLSGRRKAALQCGAEYSRPEPAGPRGPRFYRTSSILQLMTQIGTLSDTYPATEVRSGFKRWVEQHEVAGGPPTRSLLKVPALYPDVEESPRFFSL